MSPQPYDTIVIGLGAAGVTAASTLARAGRRVLALEAEDRIGGRVHTVQFGEGVVELGAEWIHGEDNSVCKLALENKIDVIPQQENFKIFRSDGSEPDTATQDLVNVLSEYCLSLPAPEEHQPLGSYTAMKLKEYLKEQHPGFLNDEEFVNQLLRFMNALVINYNAASDWNDISAWSKYTESNGHQHMSFHKHGYKTFFDILLNNYKNGTGLSKLETKLSTEVTQISWSQDPSESVTVTCADGAVYTANNVIVTVSLGVLKERYKTLFSPGIPVNKIDAIEKTSIGVMNKIILSFDEKWWPAEHKFFGLLWREEELKEVTEDDFWTTQIFGLSTALGSGNTLTLFTSGEVSKLVETLPEEVVKRKSVDILKKFMGAKNRVPQPTGMIRSTWYSNPFTRGSYTYDNFQYGANPPPRSDLATPLTDATGKPRVLFAGEATHDTHFSTVHGASDTGYREAMRLLPGASKI